MNSSGTQNHPISIIFPPTRSGSCPGCLQPGDCGELRHQSRSPRRPKPSPSSHCH